MGDYNSNNRGGRFGGRSTGRRGYGGGRNFDRPVMHKATCAECGNDCEVPFLPSGDRPVYCSNCFERRGNRDVNARSSNNGQFRPRSNDYAPSKGPDFGQLLDQLKSLNYKLDKIISILEPKEINKPSALLKLTDIPERQIENIIKKPKKKAKKAIETVLPEETKL